jgi:hypothetical protein
VGRNFLEATAFTLFENYLLALRILCIFKFFLVSPSLNIKLKSTSFAASKLQIGGVVNHDESLMIL